MGKTKKQNIEEINIDEINENVNLAKKITEDIIEYNIYVNDLNIEEEDIGAMTSILEEYLDISKKADECAKILEKNNKMLNIERLKKRLEEKNNSEDKISNLEE